MGILIYFLVLLAVGLVIWSVALSQGGIASRISQLNAPVKSSNPFAFLSRILPTKGFLENTGIYAKVKKSIDTAHVTISPEGFFNLKILVMSGLGALTWFALGKSPIYLSVALAIGYIAPDFYLRQKISKRRYEIVRRLPETVDLLGLCIEAGLDFVNAVKWVIDKSAPTPIIEELAFVLEEIKWGKPRIQA